jgi:hypothetical protein
MAFTLTAPPTDRSKWRHLLTSPRPGACGEHEVYIWTPALRDHVLGTDGNGSGA